MMGIKKKSKVKRKSQKNSSKFSYSKLFLILVIVSFFAFLTLFFVEFVDFGFVSEMFDGPYEVEVIDGCSLIMGNLVHQIRDETDCHLNCANRCEVEDANYYNSSFEFSGGGCHSCDCYCKL